MNIISVIKVFFISVATVIFSTMIFLTLPVNYKGKVFNFISVIWAKTVLFIGRVKINFEGLENIDLNKSYVFVANHQSSFDIPPFMAMVKQQMKFIAKKELTYIPFFGWCLAVGYIIVDRRNRASAIRSLHKAAKKIKKGVSVIMFPEGTRTEGGDIQQFKKGAFILAMDLKLDIIPCTIHGGTKVNPRRTLIVNKGTIHIKVDKPIPISEYNTDNKDQLIERVRNTIIQNQKYLMEKYGK